MLSIEVGRETGARPWIPTAEGTASHTLTEQSGVARVFAHRHREIEHVDRLDGLARYDHPWHRLAVVAAALLSAFLVVVVDGGDGKRDS